jgi:hypothetical protein
MQRERKLAIIACAVIIVGVIADYAFSWYYYYYIDSAHFVAKEANTYIVEQFLQGAIPYTYFLKIPLYIIIIVMVTYGFYYLKKSEAVKPKLKAVSETTRMGYTSFMLAYICEGLACFFAGLTWYNVWNIPRFAYTMFESAFVGLLIVTILYLSYSLCKIITNKSNDIVTTVK